MSTHDFTGSEPDRRITWAQLQTIRGLLYDMDIDYRATRKQARASAEAVLDHIESQPIETSHE